MRARRAPLAAALLGAAALASGCIRTDMIRYLELPPRPVEQVELLPAPPQRPHQIVARLFVEAGGGASYQELTQEARLKAAALGADALYIQEAGPQFAGTVVSPGSATTTATFTTSPSGAVTSTYVTTTSPGYAAPLFVKRVVAVAVTYAVAVPPPAPPR